MTILNDKEIIKLCKEEQMITPFLEGLVRQDKDVKVISYGISSFGYDIRLSSEDLKCFTSKTDEVDPRNIKPEHFLEPTILYDKVDNAPYVLLEPNEGLLGHSLERFKIPRNVLGQALGKSTYARCLVSVIVTPLEPSWEGDLVIEIVNHGTRPVRIYLEQGICQIIFLKGEYPNTCYADRKGKYQGQSGTQDAIV